MFPILLERKDTITQLIVKDCHERMKHMGVNSTLAELRTRYWVAQGRQLVKKVIYNCVLCQRFQCKLYQDPPSPPLPNLRIDEKPPFSYSGIDFTGPPCTPWKCWCPSPRKVWICLCDSSSPHWLSHRDESHRLLAYFKRFTARRGIPVKVLSENGKTFKAADKLISSVMNYPAVQITC